mmetsp:Transcript_87313/g.271229  ORF Transcript_87313/g.271229 Transcript_87313/m.271229 type:complete len:260 (+) Transcript_87313:935-1714(+)
MDLGTLPQYSSFVQEERRKSNSAESLLPTAMVTSVAKTHSSSARSAATQATTFSVLLMPATTSQSSRMLGTSRRRFTKRVTWTTRRRLASLRPVSMPARARPHTSTTLRRTRAKSRQLNRFRKPSLLRPGPFSFDLSTKYLAAPVLLRVRPRSTRKSTVKRWSKTYQGSRSSRVQSKWVQPWSVSRATTWTLAKTEHPTKAQKPRLSWWPCSVGCPSTTCSYSTGAMRATESSATEPRRWPPSSATAWRRACSADESSL